MLKNELKAFSDEMMSLDGEMEVEGIYETSWCDEKGNSYLKKYKIFRPQITKEVSEGPTTAEPTEVQDPPDQTAKSTWLKRLVKVAEDLEKKTEKLCDFLDRPDIDDLVSKEQLVLLHQQSTFMLLYLDTIIRRIEIAK